MANGRVDVAGVNAANNTTARQKKAATRRKESAESMPLNHTLKGLPLKSFFVP